MKWTRPILIGILNVTPDSFSDGGELQTPEAILTRVREMISQGADWIDIGGESSGPRSVAVPLEIELQRVIPVIEAIRNESAICLSVDTYKSEVARQAIRAGANIINDITALRGDSQMISVIKEFQVPVILMYSKDPTARTTTTLKDYEDVILTIKSFFEERIQLLLNEGVSHENILLDPGMGYFISGIARYSFQILRRLSELTALGYPLVIGTSRKSFLAGVSGGNPLPIQEREIPTVVSSVLALREGASLIRVHHVGYGRLAIDTFNAFMDASSL